MRRAQRSFRRTTLNRARATPPIHGACRSRWQRRRVRVPRTRPPPPRPPSRWLVGRSPRAGEALAPLAAHFARAHGEPARISAWRRAHALGRVVAAAGAGGRGAGAPPVRRHRGARGALQGLSRSALAAGVDCIRTSPRPSPCRAREPAARRRAPSGARRRGGGDGHRAAGFDVLGHESLERDAAQARQGAPAAVRTRRAPWRLGRRRRLLFPQGADDIVGGVRGSGGRRMVRPTASADGEAQVARRFHYAREDTAERSTTRWSSVARTRRLPNVDFDVRGAPSSRRPKRLDPRTARPTVRPPARRDGAAQASALLVSNSACGMPGSRSGGGSTG